MDRKNAVKTNSAKKVRRSVQHNENVYMSGDLTEEESKDTNIVKIEMKPLNQVSNRTTNFFTDLNAE